MQFSDQIQLPVKLPINQTPINLEENSKAIIKKIIL